MQLDKFFFLSDPLIDASESITRSIYWASYYQKNKARLLQKQKEYRQHPKNRAKISAYQRSYRQKNKARLSECRRLYREKNRDWIRAKAREYMRLRKQRLEVLKEINELALLPKEGKASGFHTRTESKTMEAV